MRSLWCLLVVACSPLAFADRLIDIPIARKVPIGEFRLETMFETSRARTERLYLATGLTDHIDIELHSERILPEGRVGTFDIGYNFQPPLTDLSPGISVGIQDALNDTKDGRHAYAAMTFRKGLATEGANDFVDTTLGIRVGRRTYPFVGVNLPFLTIMHGLVEDNGSRLSAGLEVRPIPVLGIRLIFQSHDTLLSAQFTHKFKS